MWGNPTGEESIQGQIVLQLNDLPIYLDVRSEASDASMKLHPGLPGARLKAPF